MKKLLAILFAVAVLCCVVACGSEGGSETGGETNGLQGFFCPANMEQEYGKSGAVKTDDGFMVRNDNNGVGGFTVGWDEEMNFNDFTMTFTPDAEKVTNDRKWMGFALTSESDTWYDSSYSILIFFRFNFENGVYNGTANFNIVATLAGFQKIEAPATEVKNVPLYMDKANTFAMKYVEAPINDWTLNVNGTSIVVKPEGESTANSTADFAKVSAAMPEGKCYLQFACNRLEDDGRSSMTVHSVNGKNVSELI